MIFKLSRLTHIRTTLIRIKSVQLFVTLAFLFTVACKDSKEKNAQKDWPDSFKIGRVATDKEISAWDIDVRPDGKGLPAGSGRIADGRNIYAAKCASCHGITGKEGPQIRLVAPMGDTSKSKAIGNYWPYASTLFDYIRRTMPYTMPGSLNDNEVYGLTAFLLYSNKIIDSTTEMNAQNLPKVVMPAQKYFVTDDRKGGPEVR